MQSRFWSSLVVLAVLAYGVPLASAATGPIENNLVAKPNVMLIVDTSGSMSWTTVRDGCFPNSTSTSCSPYPKRTRMQIAQEVLTGTFQKMVNGTMVDDFNYTRYSFPYAEYRWSYHIPYYRPSFDGQKADGILDQYKEQARFGFMSFICDLSWPSSYFYGYYASRTCHRRGVRSASTDVPRGRLISFGAPDSDAGATNKKIQDEILKLVPFNGTPIAESLDDARYFFKNNSDVTNDAYRACRDQFVLLVTDGLPSWTSCGSPVTKAHDLWAQTGVKTYVLGFGSLQGTVVDDIAAAGQTTKAYHATDKASLIKGMSEIMNKIIAGTTSRTRASHTRPSSTQLLNAGILQLSLAASFEVPGKSVNWRGHLERLDYGYDTAGTLVLKDTKDFGWVLSKEQTSRRLFANMGAPNGTLLGDFRGEPSTAPIEFAGDVNSTYAFTPTNSTRIAPYIGMSSSTASEVQAQVALIRGDAGTAREEWKLGDIYHSDPKVMTSPPTTINDPHYLTFAHSLKGRRAIVYAGSNDGVMHAFDLLTGHEIWGFMPKTVLPLLSKVGKQHVFTVDGPPVVENIQMHKRVWTDTNGKRVVGAIWRTVLIAGLRAGGRGYFAIDVTDPMKPKFMWEVNNEDWLNPQDQERGRFQHLHYTYARPAIASVLINYGNETMERAVAFLSGGLPDPGSPSYTPDPLSSETCKVIKNQVCPNVQASICATIDPATCNTDSAQICAMLQAKGCGVLDESTCTSLKTKACSAFKPTLYILDLETGGILAELSPPVADPAPLIGTPVPLKTGAGFLTSRAFVGDAKGRMFRVDTQSPDPKQWKMTLFYDSGVPSPVQSPPTIAHNANGELVVIWGTGFTDDLEGRAQYDRIISVRETVKIDSATGMIKSSGAIPNFVFELDRKDDGTKVASKTGEKLTGEMLVFDQTLYFTTFSPAENPGCEIGASRVYGIHFDDVCYNGNCVANTTTQVENCVDANGDLNIDRNQRLSGANCQGINVTVPRMTDANDPTKKVRFQTLASNSLSFGVSVVRRPSKVSVSTVYDPRLGTYHKVETTFKGEYHLIMQTGVGKDASGMTITSGTGVKVQTNMLAKRLAIPMKRARMRSWGAVLD